MKVKFTPHQTIGSHVYHIFLDESQEDSQNRGTSNHIAQTIHIATSMHPEQQQVTLLHEAIHNVCMHLGISAPESDVVALAEGLGQFLFSDLGIELDWSNVPVLTRKTKDDGRRVHKG